MISAEFLTPHLSREMPEVAAVVPWLLLLDGLMIAGAVVAMICLMFYRMRITDEAAHALTERLGAGVFRNVVSSLSKTRRVLVGLAVIVALAWGTLWIAGRARAELAELFFSVICGGVLLPTYFVVRILERAFGEVGDSIERFGSE